MSLGQHGKECLAAVKHIFWYLKGTYSVGLFYEDENLLLVTIYSDYDYARNVDSKRYMTCYVFTLGSSRVS